MAGKVRGCDCRDCAGPRSDENKDTFATIAQFQSHGGKSSNQVNLVLNNQRAHKVNNSKFTWVYNIIAAAWMCVRQWCGVRYEETKKNPTLHSKLVRLHVNQHTWSLVIASAPGTTGRAESCAHARQRVALSIT